MESKKPTTKAAPNTSPDFTGRPRYLLENRRVIKELIS